ncbi:MAG: cytochrome P450 [Cyanobacteriota bacterium]|nr:cytochrome P450 [Cyanobacteriota bacterium]
MSLPPKPQTPATLRMLQLIFRPLAYFDNYGKQYGDFFRVGSAEMPFVYVNHPQAIQTIFTASPDTFDTTQRQGFLRLLLGDNSLLFSQGNRHQRQRRLLMPPFHGDCLRAYSQSICEITRQVTQQWEIGKVFSVRATMQEITLRTILQVVFGIQEGERYNRLRRLMSSMLDSIASPLSSSLMFFPSLQKDWGNWSPWGRFLQRKREIDELLYAEIRERRSRSAYRATSRSQQQDDILSLLLAARDETGEGMSDRELRDELMTLLFAGHETTSSALCWGLYWIHALPEVEEKLRSQLADIKSSDDAMLATSLPYLTAVCQETLRIYPIAPTTFFRRLKVPLQVMNYRLEPGTFLVPCIYLVHQREDIYPQPKQFKPERFLERSFSPYEYLPFGGGTRRCIGAALAMMEMQLVLATILEQFQLTLTSSRPLKPVRRGITLAPPSSLKMVAIARR